MIQSSPEKDLKKSAGYMYKAEYEFIFGVDNIQELYNHLFDIFTEHPEFVNRSGRPRGKYLMIRRMLEQRLGRPIANTDKDLGGRVAHWVTYFLSGKLTKQMIVQPMVKPTSVSGVIVDIPKGMTIKQISVLVPEGDEIDSYRITFKKKRL